MIAKLTGLFLGAGASYEVGMPLVWELTEELFRWLTPSKLRDLNQHWRAHGGGRPDEVIDDLAAVLVLPGMHYESVLGYLETQYRRPGAANLQQEYHAIYSWLVEMVSHLLYLRHMNNAAQIHHRLKYLDGIAHLAAANKPLWIFSLNHDVIIESLAARHGIPVSAGFGPEVIALPRRATTGTKLGELRGEVLSEEQINKTGMPFTQYGSPGINLLKIHGSLDVFAFRNGKDLVRLLPLDATVDGVFASLKAANEELLYPEPRAPGGKTSVTNEIAYADDQNEMQFLRRSLLAGAYKFDPHRDQVLPKQLLSHFLSHINFVTSLVCIGYGFGDIHINEVIRDWLAFSAERRLEIVGPGIQTVPSFLLHLLPQVELIDATATEYLDRRAGIVRSRTEQVEKRFAKWARGRSRSFVNKALEAFSQLHMKRVAERLAGELRTMPMTEGDVDLSRLGTPRDEVVRELVTKLGLAPESILEDFLASCESNSEVRVRPPHEQIAEAAYYRWLGRGRQHGLEVEDWLVAEAHLAR